MIFIIFGKYARSRFNVPALLYSQEVYPYVADVTPTPFVPMKVGFMSDFMFKRNTDGSTHYYKDKTSSNVQYTNEDYVMFRLTAHPIDEYKDKFK